MPKLVRLAASQTYVPETDEDKKVFDAIKKRGVMEMSYVTARENVKNSKGMLTFYAPEPVAAAAPGPRRLEDMDMDELKLSMLSLGIKTQKKMKRDDVIRLIRDRMSEVEIVDDEDEGAE